MTAAGDRRELARYQLPDATRAIVAQRIDGRVAISDVPLTDDGGRVYLIERHVTSQAELAGPSPPTSSTPSKPAAPPSSPSATNSTSSLTPSPDQPRVRRALARRTQPPPNRENHLMPKHTPLTDVEREQRRAADRAFAQQAVDALRSSEGWQRWLSTRRHFHSYSLRNQLLIAMQDPDATRVAGFKAWLALGYCVRRGEKALRIYAPCPPSKAKLKAWRDAGAAPAQKPRTFFRLTAVFDRSQVDELPPPAEPAPLDPPATAEIDGNELEPWLDPLTALAAEIGSTVTYEAIASGADGYYRPTTKAITVEANHPANRQVKTLVHELAHALVRTDHHHARDHREDGIRLVIISVIEGIELYANSKGLATRRLGKECLPFPPEQQIEVRRARGQLDWSAEEVDATVDDLFQAELERARRLLSTAGRGELAALRDRPLLEAMRLIGGQGAVTNAAVLLFGAEDLIRHTIPAHGYSYQYRPSPGSEATYSSRGARAIPAAVEALLELIDRRVETRPLNLSGGIQLSLTDYPSSAVREVVVNAHIHRDFPAGGSVDIEHSAERLAVQSLAAW